MTNFKSIFLTVIPLIAPAILSAFFNASEFEPPREKLIESLIGTDDAIKDLKRDRKSLLKRPSPAPSVNKWNDEKFIHTMVCFCSEHFAYDSPPTKREIVLNPLSVEYFSFRQDLCVDIS